MRIPVHVRVPLVPVPVSHAPAPTLPPGQHVELPGRGTTFVRQVQGPVAAPTLVLLHGLTASADLNWARAYAHLGEAFNVVALDHRGHGQGIRSSGPFTLEDCADDVAALVDLLDLGPVVVVGYSMGGPIAQLVARSRPDLVRGLVLCCTSGVFRDHVRERLAFATLPAATLAARWMPPASARALVQLGAGFRHAGHLEEWMLEEVRRSDPTAVLEAANALGHFDSRPWVGDLGVPSEVVAATCDQLVPFERQLALALALGDAPVHLVQGDHYVAASAPGDFNRALRTACESVVFRSGQVPVKNVPALG